MTDHHENMHKMQRQGYSDTPVVELADQVHLLFQSVAHFLMINKNGTQDSVRFLRRCIMHAEILISFTSKAMVSIPGQQDETTGS